MIEVKNLSKSFDDKIVLEGLNFKIDDGKVFGLVGINGAGKSTLLRIMSDVYSPDKGEVLYDNQNVKDNENIKKDIFFLSDFPYYPKKWNIKNFLNFYNAFYNINIATFNKLLSEFKLPIKKSIHNFSKGMKRQLFISLAIAISPKYLLLDEAFDGLDPLAKLIFKKSLFEALDNKRMTIIISSHSLKELQDICDSYGIIDEHKIICNMDMNMGNENVNAYQIVFDSEKNVKNFKDFEVVDFSKTGKVIKIVIKGDKKEVMSKLKKMKPLVLESIPLDFEDLFIYEVNKKGYVKNEK